MNVRAMLVGTVAIAGAMAAFAFWIAASLPPGTDLPTHWNAAGEIDGTMPALQALLIPAGVTLAVGLLTAALPILDPRTRNAGPALGIAWTGLMGVMVVTQLMIAGPALGWQVGPSALIAGVGVLLVALGNFLPKSRPNLFVGIRTPWTLRDTDNWIATHRLGGKLLMAAGLIIILAAVLPLDGTSRTAILLVALLAAALAPVGYSWWLSRAKKPGG